MAPVRRRPSDGATHRDSRHLHFGSAALHVLNEMDAADAQAAYRGLVEPTLETDFLSARFSFGIHRWNMGALRCTRLDSGPRRTERTPQAIARDGFSGISAQLAISGTASGLAAGREVISSPGSLMLLDYGKPFVIVDQTPRLVLDISIPKSVWLRRFGRQTNIHGQVIAAPCCSLFARFAQGLHIESMRQSEPATQNLSDITLDILAYTLNFADHPDLGREADPKAALRQRAERLIQKNLGLADLSPVWMADKLNLSRTELYELFAGEAGIARMIRQRRLIAAHKALNDPADRRRIGDIAFSVGFISEAHFSRAFKHMYGCTPSAARRTPSPAVTTIMDQPAMVGTPSQKKRTTG